MRRVAGFLVVVVAVLSSPVALASGDAVADLQTQLHALAHAKTAAVAPAREIDDGFSGVNVTREAKTVGDLASTAAQQAATPVSGLHH